MADNLDRIVVASVGIRFLAHRRNLPDFTVLNRMTQWGMPVYQRVGKPSESGRNSSFDGFVQQRRHSHLPPTQAPPLHMQHCSGVRQCVQSLGGGAVGTNNEADADKPL